MHTLFFVVVVFFSFFFSLSLFFFTLLSLTGKSDCLTWVRLQQPQEQRYPFLTVRAVLSCVQTKVWVPVIVIFNVRTDVNACDCTWGFYGRHRRVCTEKVDFRRKIPRLTGESNLPLRRSGPTLS